MRGILGLELVLPWCGVKYRAFALLGAAAGVAAMGMGKIDFFWYMKKIFLLALLGYLAGAFTFIAQHYSQDG